MVVQSDKDSNYLTLEEALAIAKEIYANLQKRENAARLAEVEYWKFLDDEDDEE